MRLHTTLLLTALLGLAAGVATPAQASDRYLSGYSGSGAYSRGGYGYGGHSASGGYKGSHGGGYYYHPTSSGSSSSPRLYHYTARGSGGGRYNFNFFRGGYDSRNGYSGPNTSIDHPHRSDWEAYMRRLQRQSSNQQASDTTDLCGNYLRAPARCRDTTTRYDPVRYVEIRYIPEISGAYR